MDSSQGLDGIGYIQTVSQEASVCSPESLATLAPALCLVPSFQHPELLPLMVTVANAVPSLHIPDQFILVCKYQVYQSTCPLLAPRLCQQAQLLAPDSVSCRGCLSPSVRCTYHGAKLGAE